MDEFATKYNNLMELLPKIGLPQPQCEHIKRHPIINPNLDPLPQNWWTDSFEWFIAIELIPGVQYGAFYILHDDWFWPQIGDQELIFSEKKCFFGLEIVKNIHEAEKKYKIHRSNFMKYLYEFKFDIDCSISCNTPLIFIGPVKDGTGYQMNPNRLSSKAIKIAIAKNEVRRFKVNKKGEIMLTRPEVYKACNNTIP
jgi:hypothetical protein